MRTEQPKMIYLKDYQAPEYLIDETHLTFELFGAHAGVLNYARRADKPCIYEC